jgi:hypothetical protein
MAMSRIFFSFGSSLRSTLVVACTRTRTTPFSRSTRFPRPLLATVTSAVSTRITAAGPEQRARVDERVPVGPAFLALERPRVELLERHHFTAGGDVAVQA